MRPFWQAMGDGIKAVWRWLWEHEAVRTAWVLQALAAGALAETVRRGWLGGEVALAIGGIVGTALQWVKTRNAVVSQATHEREVEQALNTMPPGMSGQRLP